MQEVLQTQFDFSQNLLKSLQSVVSTYDTLVSNTQTQSDNIVRLVGEIDKSKDRMNRLLERSSKLVKDINASLDENYVKNIQKRSKDSQDIFAINMNDMQKQFMMFFNTMSKSSKEFNRLLKNSKLSEKQIKQLSLIGNSFKQFNKDLDDVSSDVDDTTGMLETFETIADKANVAKNAVLTGGTSLFIDVPNMLFGLMSSAMNALSSFIGAASKFYMFTLTLPFTISKIAATLGNTIRSDLLEVIQAAGEEAKEAFDLTSKIGQGADTLTQNSKKLLKEFQNPRNRLAQLFGTGAEGAATFQKEAFDLVANMGHYAEVFGPSILSNTKTAQYLLEVNKALAIGAQESAYYALDAYTSGKNPVEYMDELSTKIKKVADENELDTKQIAISFHKLKTNIVDFGHLTSNEVLNLTTKLTKMRVSSDDAVNVFKKFTSLEEASKASAMLFQSFNMNIDAFDLLTSRDPAEMLMQFKNAMQSTGKSFENLDRHERALMQSITGISEQGLSSMMSLMDSNMSYEEARSKMDQHNPTKQKTKMIKNLSTSIKQFQKILQFNSPFEAFFSGIMENSLAQKELQGSLMDFNKVYESIYKIAFDLKPAEIEAFTKPVVAVLTKIRNIFISGDFLKLIKMVTKTTSDFMSDFAIDLYSQKDAKNFHLFRLKVSKTFENLNHNQSEIIKVAMMNSVNFNLLTMRSFLDAKNAPAEFKNIFKKNKAGVYRLAKGMTVDKLLGSLASISENLPKDSKYKLMISQLRSSLDDTYLKEVKSINGTKEMEKAQRNVESRVSVKGRIDRLYDNLLNLFTEGSPLFKQFHDTAGRIMGSMITGAMEGMIALINLFNGGVDQSVTQLGLVTEEEMLKQFGKKDVTLLDLLGINTSDVTELENDLAKESSRFVDNLPSMMSIAGSLFGDLTDLFKTFAFSVVGLIGGFTLKYYNSVSDAERAFMVTAGFNPMKAIQAKLRGKKAGEYKKGDMLKSIVSSTNAGGMEGDLGIIAATADLINNYKKSLNKKSMVYQFLDNKNIKNQVDFLFGGFNSALAELADPDKERVNRSRIQGLYHIIETAKKLDMYIPNSLYDIAEGKDNKYAKRAQDFIREATENENYNKVLNEAINVIPSGSINFYRAMSDIDEHSDEQKRYIENINKYEKRNKNITNLFTEKSSKFGKYGYKSDESKVKKIKSLLSARNNKNQKQVFKKQKRGVIDSLVGAYRDSESESDFLDVLLNPSSIPFLIGGSALSFFADDFYAKEKNMKILIGNQIVNLNDEDTIVAFKSGGYFDKLFSFNNNNIKLLEKENIQIKVENSNLKKIVQEVESNIEETATEEDLFELFTLFNEVADLLENREIIVEKPQIVFS